ncbi:MAG: peptidoglycan DD-metalloendopeptidase family protein [Bacteroidia bacterium]
MRKKKINYMIAGVLLMAVPAFLLMGCAEVKSVLKDGYSAVAETVNPLTPRKKYAKELAVLPEMAQQWQQSYDTALKDSLQVALPYAERGYFRTNQSPAYSYDVVLQQGEMLQAAVATDSLSDKVFIDVLYRSDEGWEHFHANENAERSVVLPALVSGTYKIIVQPELSLNSAFVFRMEKKPLYTFPVAGKGNKDIGSFWGMERDGGKRKHEGIDIFAKRGTPIVAVTDGSVTYTGEKGIGGKQVWLLDRNFGTHIYYAHLDKISVTDGVQVKTGDTLGFVGNTGNARTTAPHLHFGVYRGGAVNPLPFVYQVNAVAQKQLPYLYTTEKLLVKSVANLRLSPSSKSAVVGSALKGETVTLLGQSNEWLHVITGSGKRAFINRSLISTSI